MNAKVYNIIWADDDIATLDKDEEIRSLFLDKGICLLKGVTTSERLRQALDMFKDKVDAFIIDAKDCKSGRFPLTRVEENQFLSMSRWLERTQHEAFFALQLPDEEDVYFIPFKTICNCLDNNVRSLNSEAIKECSFTFREIF